MFKISFYIEYRPGGIFFGKVANISSDGLTVTLKQPPNPNERLPMAIASHITSARSKKLGRQHTELLYDSSKARLMMAVLNGLGETLD